MVAADPVLFADPGTGDSHTHETSAAKPEEAPQLVFGSAEEFLHEQLLPTYVRDVDDRGAKWCMEWYFHAEAVSRVEELWRPWEHLRLDHHMRVLLDARGPFYNCDKSGHRGPAHLEPLRAPAGWSPT